MSLIKRVAIEIHGIVQGVGFRPFVYNLARRHALTGFILNDVRGVYLEAEGASEAIEHFVNDLVEAPPPLVSIDALRRNDIPVHGPMHEPMHENDAFRILDSDVAGERRVFVSPDIAPCCDCLEELDDPQNRRYRYPFINCTNCGPRFTIVEDTPYDRAKTTMKIFTLCRHCAAEFHNPANRRFHAQPNACAECGPQLRIDGLTDSQQVLDRAVDLLKAGRILAIKGLGGYHLACDALNPQAVTVLRQRKYREDKPFALMAPDLVTVTHYCRVHPQEAALMQDRRRPIVLLERKPEDEVASPAISPQVAPNCRTLGFMLPYTPMHYLLIQRFAQTCPPGLLVMTSGNISDEPIAYHDDDAQTRLRPIADHYLTHNRPIHICCDDSVVRLWRKRPLILRRSRGYAPEPLRSQINFTRPVLACGAELKNTFCLARGHTVFLSHHIGDLENWETYCAFVDGIDHFRNLFSFEPDVIAYDLHPEYLSTKYALAAFPHQRTLGIQHHHAHLASCMLDNDLDGDVLGVAFDGLGYGADGKLWGGEFLRASYADFDRCYHLRYMPMPGGAKAIREPWRMAAAYVDALSESACRDAQRLTDYFPSTARDIVSQMIRQRVNCPETSSMGRLFDAVASMVLRKPQINYEGQAAIDLETLADRRETGTYPFRIEASEIDPLPVFEAVVSELRQGISVATIAARFHNTVAQLTVSVCNRMREETGLSRVVLSGGVFQNTLLLDKVALWSEQNGFQVFCHHRVPPNDGGICLGQAAIAQRCEAV